MKHREEKGRERERNRQKRDIVERDTDRRKREIVKSERVSECV